MDLKLIETVIDSRIAENILILKAILREGRLKKMLEPKFISKEITEQFTSQPAKAFISFNEPLDHWAIYPHLDTIDYSEMRHFFLLTLSEESELHQTVTKLKDLIFANDISITISPCRITILNFSSHKSFNMDLFQNQAENSIVGLDE